MLARERDAGFRGAAPFNEPINRPIPLPNRVEVATLLAADGSQIYPDLHGAALYWLTNIGVFIYHHGPDQLPELVSEPQLYYQEEEVRELDGRVIANAAINARRAVYEMQLLARETERCREMAEPLVAIYDGPLLLIPMGREISNANELTAGYHEAMSFIQDAGASLLGYVDRPTSRFVVYTIYLMSLEPDEIWRGSLYTCGSLEGLSDADLYRVLLGPGERSGLMIQQSPQNKEYKEKYDNDQEIVFFYLNVASTYQDPYLARIEIPMWVARHKARVDAVHALIYDQCQITDRYPYVLVRADETAVVHPHEKRALDEMIAVELLRNRQPIETSQKLNSKSLARYGNSQFEGD